MADDEEVVLVVAAEVGCGAQVEVEMDAAAAS